MLYSNAMRNRTMTTSLLPRLSPHEFNGLKDCIPSYARQLLDNLLEFHLADVLKCGTFISCNRTLALL
jgi:hypothetical protein